MKELARGYQLENTLRRSLCAMVLLGYHLLVVYVLGNTDGDLVQASAILDDQLKVRLPLAEMQHRRGLQTSLSVDALVRL